MLHIKSNNDAVVGIDTRTGTSRSLGTLEFIAGSVPTDIDITSSNGLTFEDKWTSLTSTFRGSRVSTNNEIDTSRSLAVMSFIGNNSVFLDIDTVHPMSFYGRARFNLRRNKEQHLRETDAFSIRIEHEITSSYLSPGVPLVRPATILLPSKSVAGETNIEYQFIPASFANRGWDYIQFNDQNGVAIDRTNLGAPDPADQYSSDTTWINLSTPSADYGGVKLYIRDVFIKKVNATTELHSANIRFSTSGQWEIKFDDVVAQAYKNLPVGKKLRIRFAFSLSPMAMLNNTLPIISTFLDNKTVARASVLESSVISEDGRRGVFKFNRAAYVSAYLNGTQVTERVHTTAEGELTINFNQNLNEGATLELRLSTLTPANENNKFIVNVTDTVAPPPIVATIFTSTRIFGNGGSVGDFAVAKRDDVEIGRVAISGNLEYMITLNPGVVLSTGEYIEVYAMDTVGNMSETELYEIDVAETTDGIFSPNLGNDSISSTTIISRG